MMLLWRGGYSGKVQWTLGLVVIGSWVITALVLRERVVRPLQTLSNMLAALREGDYSIRARGADREDALGLAFLESNLLGETLRTQRLGAMEATALLRTVMAEIDVAVFAFDDASACGSSIAPASDCSRKPAERLLGRTAEQVGPRRGARRDPSPRTMDVTFPGGCRTMGSAARVVSPGRTAAHAARARRREQDAARGGTPGVAATRARAQSRDQQLARADQIDHRKPARIARSQRRAPPTPTTICVAG